MDLARFPRVRLAHLPTPLERLPRLSDKLGVEVWIKRDDCTGFAGGGNKTRKLEFLLGRALELGADTLITQGAVQSNHVRQTAAAAAAHGLPFEVILEERTPSETAEYKRNGNVLLNRLFGAGMRTVPGGTDVKAELQSIADRVSAEGGRPFIVPGGGSSPVGALGYVDCARELSEQAEELGLRIDRIITPTGSGGTQAGLVAGLAVLGIDIPVLGIGVRFPRQKQEARILELARATAALLGHPDAVTEAMVVADCDFVGDGYGLIDEAVIEALKMAARSDGIVLDPVYTGKAMKGLIALARAGRLEDETVVFLHTGGSEGLFAYESQLAASF
jgi:L-cysteate sulfo-lyase